MNDLRSTARRSGSDRRGSERRSSFSNRRAIEAQADDPRPV
jgi:hypothetical protein